MAPGEAAYAAFTTQVSGEASTIEAKAEYNGIVRETQKTVPVLTYGKVVLFNELTGSGKERYKDQKTSFRENFMTHRQEGNFQGPIHTAAAGPA